MSELDEKRAAKNGIITVTGLINQIHEIHQKEKMGMMAVVWVDEDGQIYCGYSEGSTVTYLGLVEVLRNDILTDVLETQTGDI